LQEYVKNERNWTLVTANSTHPSAPHEGTYMAKFANSSSSNSDITKLITPPINITGLAVPTLKFWHFQERYDSDRDQLKIYYKTSSANEWKLLAEYIDPVAEWTERSIDLPEASATYFIAFEGIAKYGYGVILDDIRILQGTPRNDVQLLAIKTDGDNRTITAVIKNLGNVPVTSMKASYKLNDGTPVVEQVTANIAPLVGIYEYTFSTTVPRGYYDLEVAVELTGDQNPDNNSAARQFINYPEVTLTGYRVYDSTDDAPNAMVSFTTNNPQDVTVLSSFIDAYYNDNYTVGVGEFLNNKVHTWFCTTYAPLTVKNYGVFSANNWDLLSFAPISEDDNFHNDMTYNHKTNTMYSVKGRDIQTVNLETGLVSGVAGTIDRSPIAMACDLSGTLYVVDHGSLSYAAGNFCKVNTNDFTVTVIGPTGFEYPHYRQSMTFDHVSGRLFWAAGYVSNGMKYKLLEIDITTGKAWEHGTIGNGDGTEICGLFIPFGGVGISENILPNVNVYSHLNTIYIVNEEQIPLKAIQVFDIMGRMIYQNSAVGVTSFTLSTATGVYMVRLIAENGKVFAGKVHLMR
jgi:hypothetical protein